MALIDPLGLSDIFQQVIDLYSETTQGGDSLVDLLKRDWHLFETMNDDKCYDLLGFIYPGTSYKGKSYQPRIYPDSIRIDRWNIFREELKHKNRYFPQQAPDLEHLRNLFSYMNLPIGESPELMYRARCNNEERMFSVDEMKKPPERAVSGGRANPIGIPYLYTASDPLTAIAEIRPHKGDSISVAEILINKRLILADLRNPRKTISPFKLIADDVNPYIEIEYLCKLGEELTKPILPRDAHLEYLPTQYLCEFIKHCGFDGVVYKSSVGEGDNYAIFNDDKLTIADVFLYNVKETIINAEKVDG
ncbi:MAG: RES domain-containing protein [Nitrospinae bacterium]|nr:RES domain-containing protein [Nitrospinota bacterium]